MKWMWEGVMSMDVPERWSVRETSDVIEITPPNSVGAAHVTVLRRTKSDAVAEGEAASLARSFARKQGVDIEASEIRRGLESLSTASFTSGSGSEALHWEVETRVWTQGAVICSYCHDGQHPDEREAAVRIFRSIEPIPNRPLPYRM
jgi:hypothetical protein